MIEEHPFVVILVLGFLIEFTVLAWFLAILAWRLVRRFKALQYLLAVWFWIDFMSFHIHTEIPSDIYHLTEWYW